MAFRYFSRQCPAGSVPYVLRSGDTLNKIAMGYNTSVEEIVLANPGINPNNLRVGQQICVPLGIQLYPSCPTTNYYVVVAGDTFDSIATFFNITTLQLLYSNYGIDPNNLYLDQMLCIPVAPSPVNVTVNIRDKKLNVFRNGTIFATFNIAAENPTRPVPRGTFTVLNKQVDTGVERGARWIGLSRAGFGIHGLNTPVFIDIVATDNNIVMSNQDVSKLFNYVPVGTVINII